MKRERVFVVFITFFIGLALAYLFAKSPDKSFTGTSEAMANEDAVQTRNVTFDSRSTGSLGSGDTLVELIPVRVDKDRVVLQFTINTHSVRLNNFDLTEITTLEYGGKELKPVKASRMGDHHSSGTIEFETGEEIGSFIIKIIGIPRVEERVFKWSV